MEYFTVASLHVGGQQLAVPPYQPFVFSMQVLLELFSFWRLVRASDMAGDPLSAFPKHGLCPVCYT